MKLTAILAVSTDGAIGDTRSPTGMPWPRLARDMKRFRDATMGRMCIVGRKTYDTLPPLPGRKLWVLTRGQSTVMLRPGVCAWPPSVDMALWALSQHREPEVFVIGGAEVYRALLPLCDRILLTEVHASYPDADVRLGPVASITDGFRMLGRETHDPDESSPARVSFSEWVRL